MTTKTLPFSLGRGAYLAMAGLSGSILWNLGEILLLAWVFDTTFQTAALWWLVGQIILKEWGSFAHRIMSPQERQAWDAYKTRRKADRALARLKRQAQGQEGGRDA